LVFSRFFAIVEKICPRSKLKFLIANFTMQIDRKSIVNILVVRNDRFGEFLLNIPALRALKETFVNAKVIAVIDPQVRELTERIPYIDEAIEWDRNKHSLFEKIKLINLLSKKHIDAAVMLNPSKDFNILTFFADIPIRVGYDRKWGFLLTHKIKDRKYLGNKHEIEYNLELVGLVGAKTKDRSLFLNVDESSDNNLLNNLNLSNEFTLIVLHPWTSDPIKQWPLENFSALAKKLTESPYLKVVIVGGNDSLNKSIEFCQVFGKKVINLTGKTSLLQLALVLKKSKLLISCDSGPVHLASCVGTPAIALFRNDLPGKTPTRWGPSGKGHFVIEKANLSEITVEEVLNKVKEVLHLR